MPAVGPQTHATSYVAGGHPPCTALCEEGRRAHPQQTREGQPLLGIGSGAGFTGAASAPAGKWKDALATQAVLQHAAPQGCREASLERFQMSYNKFSLGEA